MMINKQKTPKFQEAKKLHSAQMMYSQEVVLFYFAFFNALGEQAFSAEDQAEEKCFLFEYHAFEQKATWWAEP